MKMLWTEVGVAAKRLPILMTCEEGGLFNPEAGFE